MALSGKSVIRTKIQVDDAKKSAKDVEGFTKKLDGLTRVANGSASGLAAFGPHAAAAAAGIAAIGLAAGAAAKAIQALIQGFIELGQRGGEFSAIASGYERIGSAETLRNLQELSGWHIQQRDIMTSYTRAMDVGLVTQEQYAEALQLLTARAQQTGQGVTEMLRQFSPVLEGRGIEQVTALGVEIGEINDRIRAMGVSAESARGRQMRLNAALEIARERLGEVDNHAANLADAWEAMSTQANDYIDNMARVVSESPALVAVFESLRESIFGVGTSAEDMGRIVQLAFESAAIGLLNYAETMVSQVLLMSTAVSTLFSHIVNTARSMGFSIPETSVETGLERLRVQVLEWQNNIRRARVLGEAMRGGRGGAKSSGGTPPGRGRGAGGGSELSEAQQADEEFFNDLIMLRMELEDQAHTQRLEHNIELNTARQEMADLWTSIDEENASREQEHHEQQIRNLEEQARLWDEFKTEQEDAAAEAMEAQAERQANIFENITSMASSTQKIFNAVSSVIGSISGDTEEAARRQGAFVIAFSGVMAAVELAQSIASFAEQDYAAGVAHLAAMAAFIAAAAQASADLGGGTAKTPAGGQSFTPAAVDNVQTQQQEQGSITIVESYSFGHSSVDIGRSMRDADWVYRSSGETSARGLSAEFGV